MSSGSQNGTDTNQIVMVPGLKSWRRWCFLRCGNPKASRQRLVMAVRGLIHDKRKSRRVNDRVSTSSFPQAIVTLSLNLMPQTIETAVPNKISQHSTRPAHASRRRGRMLSRIPRGAWIRRSSPPRVGFFAQVAILLENPNGHAGLRAPNKTP